MARQLVDQVHNFVAAVKDSTKKTRLIPFEFSTTQTYMLEFGNQYIRFYKDNGQILSSGSAYEISTPYLEAELFDIKICTICRRYVYLSS